MKLTVNVYNRLYVCPICSSEHTVDEWNEATEEDFGGNIMPMELADAPDYSYTCPTCSHESELINIHYKIEE